ncbi:hypothetical protein CLPUN_23030 [Clostridium puniceum]|uniref:Uncharacterized protein n=1 Tax=Clostridium puniceum TaxID=29367 RepID=A0A1S8TIG2_9CLOT|nr:hypothetical protein [Clostridium puniceum]OOM77404.1 hypothetical protein CLPUN_23030 [Clostridium puniceum]
MENIKFSKSTMKNLKKTISIIKPNTNEYKIYTPEIIEKYKKLFKTILKMSDNKIKTKFIMYNKVSKWYEEEKNINISLEKIYIKTKLGSFTSGGCGIGASLLAGLTASGIYSYMDSYIKKLGPFFLILYVVFVLSFGIKILYNEDNKVEMYNMFLEALNALEREKHE